MTAPKSKKTSKGSAFPVRVDDLLPAARKLAVELGVVPSQNKLKDVLKVGKPKAKAVREALLEAGFDPSDPSAEPARLRLVTDTEPHPERGASQPATREMTEAEAAQLDAVNYLYPIDDSGVGESERLESDPAYVAHGQHKQPQPGCGYCPDVDGRPIEMPSAPWEPAADGEPAAAPAAPKRRRAVATWPVLLLAAPAMVAIWAGWVGLGELTGFGEVDLLPGIAPSGGWATLNTAITLPIGMETYAAYALRVWLAPGLPARARRFAMVSAIAALALGWAGQATYHVMSAAGFHAAPWLVTVAVSSLPVAVLGMGAALAHLIRDDDND